ncbi:MAG TPA: peptidoglycan-binding protein [Caulobacteraceae bacterium]|jgi:lytic murein transglycosylase|nr:peptidoglycan-binding protein [Caulobacteraceae bacterium]
MDRRFFLSLAVAGLAGAAHGQSASPTPAELLGASGEPFFIEWLNGFYDRALAAGLPRSVVDRELSGLSPDPRVTALDARQPEFARPVSDYVRGAISPQRVAAGRAKRSQLTAFSTIEQTYGAPRDILIGIWAMESGFGVQQGEMDVIRSLATLALGRRRAWAEVELIAALKLIADGDVTRARLRGSWAGAMGQTQILPTVYLTTAVGAFGGRRPDIWNSPADALATAANLLAKDGWRRGEAWAPEIILPRGFDYGLSEGPKEPIDWWLAKGARLAHQDAYSRSGGAAAVLLLPSGAEGPAFLALPNHFAIRGYNNSIAYALAVGLLADRFAGGAGVVTPWPHEIALSLDERLAAQAALAKLGFNPGVADGLVGVSTRAALRSWQKTQGLPADGYLSAAMVERLKSAAARA